MGRKRVILKGGLGNQLFQWGFAHLLQAQGHDVSLVAFEKKSFPSFEVSQHSRFSDLRKIMENCNCLEIETIFLDIRFYRVIRDPEAKRNPFRIFPNFIRNYDENPFQYIETESISRVRNLSGYFQNFELFRPVQNTLAMELRKFLNGQALDSKNFPQGECNIIHIRRGDFATPSHFSTIGILSSEYYIRATKVLNVSPWVAVTDDPLNVSDVTSLIQIDKILGPSDLDTIGALRTMANARNLVISNSTLSWWDGFMAVHQGGRVVAPSRWHRSADVSSLNVLKHQKFETAEADFFQDIHEYEVLKNLSEY